MNLQYDEGFARWAERIQDGFLANSYADYSLRTKCAILRAVVYVLRADGDITRAKNKFFVDLAMKYAENGDPSMIDIALVEMDDDEMLKRLNTILGGRDNGKYLLVTLFKAAECDGTMSEESINTIIGIIKATPTGKIRFH